VAARYYDLAVKETSFEVVYRVLVWHPPGEFEVGRKLRVPWIGPYRFIYQHSLVSYSLKAEVGEKLARAHVNRLQKVEPEALVETSEPKDGLWPDSSAFFEESCRPEPKRTGEYNTRSSTLDEQDSYERTRLLSQMLSKRRSVLPGNTPYCTEAVISPTAVGILRNGSGGRALV
jgi:hypothetical protein